MKYQPKHVQQLFSKSPETIRLWSLEFAQFLSTDANPGSGGGHRRYTDDDLRVFSHINIRKAEGATNESISAELTNGQRATPPRDVVAIIAADEKSEVMLLQNQVIELEVTVSELRESLTWATTRADRAEGAIAYSDGLHRAEIERLEKRLDDKESLIRDLYQQLTRHEAKED